MRGSPTKDSMNLDNWTIRSKLIAGFGLVLVIACIVSLLGIANLSSMNDRSVEISRKSLPSVSAAGAISRNLSALRIARLGLILAGPNSPMPQAIATVENASTALNKSVEEAAPCSPAPRRAGSTRNCAPRWRITARRCRSS